MTALLHCIGAHVHSRRGFGTHTDRRLSNHPGIPRGRSFRLRYREIWAPACGSKKRHTGADSWARTTPAQALRGRRLKKARARRIVVQVPL